jgi:hypothetical protein
MPIRSKKQWGWLAKYRPDLLSSWQHEAKRSYSKLPTRVKSKKK